MSSVLRRRVRANAPALVLVLGLAALASGGCQTDSAERAASAELSSACLVNSDCAAPLVCAFQRCHVECVTTRDCDGTLRCVGAREAARVCQLEIEASCKTAADCVAGFACGADGACRDTCEIDQECIGEQVCAKGVCAEPTELDASGNVPQLLPFENCRLSSDCALGSICARGTCLPECVTERDCPTGQRCEAGVCTALEPSACETGDECTPPGATCVDGQCQCPCSDDADCAIGASCDGCACLPLPEPECASAADCTPGKQCVDGACICACVEDRDCAAGSICDGCACSPAPATTINDATLKDASDVDRMYGIEEVLTKLILSGSDLISTIGLESLHTVGSLEVTNALNGPTDAETPSQLAGLTGLTLIRGDLRIQSSPLRSLDFSPLLQIGGNVSIQATPLTCAELGAFQQTLVTQGFSGAFEAMFNGGCPGACSNGNCFPVP